MAQQIEPGDWLQGPFWRGSVQVISIQPRTEHDLLTVHAPDQDQSQIYVLTPSDWERVRRIRPADYRSITFSGDPDRFRLGIQAYRLRLAHSIDPYAALNASRIDPLPHQFEAVYEHLLARPMVRALLAHDAGAGKTIMAGLVIKELQRRQGIQRVLIVAPAGLTIQWRRELLTKFGEDFTIVSRDYMEEQRLDSLDVWRETDRAITSIAFARQKSMRQALESVEWDMVVVDEAHKMAAYLRPNGSVRKTQAYQLGEVLSRHSTHFLLMTATPHKGDPDNYRLLIRLIDAQWSEATRYVHGSNPIVLRRTKEEMCKPDGSPLYPERIVETLPYTISPQEGALIEQVQRFIRTRHRKAKRANQQSAAFALITLERRLASSPYALRESLQRMRQDTEERLSAGRAQVAADRPEGDWADWEELSERERWERERQAEAAAVDLTDRRQLRRELHRLDTLITRTEEIIHRGEQEKITELHEACDLWVGERGEQLIVFTEFKDTLDYLVQCLAAWGYTTTQIHGGMPVKERRRAEKALWKGEAQVLVATEAAGEGINLQCCSVMINFDIPWNPCRLEQRMGRIHRYGQEAEQVHVFNLVATNTMEDEVKAALLDKMKAMRKDLKDKVFNVVGEVLWGKELRNILERIALGEREAVDEAKQLIDQASDAAQEAIDTEAQVAATAEPIDVLEFQRNQAVFAAHRLSPETSESFFRQAVPFLRGSFREFTVQTDSGVSYPAFDVGLPPDLTGGHRAGKLRLSFWPEVCSDDETEEDAILFIGPGHQIFEALLDRVVERCASDLNRGAVLFDLYPEDDSPYLAWFVHGQIKDGLGRHVTDLLGAFQHRADEEEITPLPTEVLDGFDLGVGPDVDEAIQRVKPMLTGQSEVIDQCIGAQFLPALAERRMRRRQALERDRHFLKEGLTTLIDGLNEAALDAYSEGATEEGDRLVDRGDAARQRLARVQAELEQAGHILLTAPDVLGVALVLPAPVAARRDAELDERRPAGVPMRRDPAVEQAAMQIVMEHEKMQGRYPRDVHEGNSWDIESEDAAGIVTRFIEVKGRGPEGADEVWLTDPELKAARRLGDRHWLYIVRLGDGMIWMIQNPATKLQPKEVKRWTVSISDASPHAEIVSLEKKGGE